MVGSSQLCHLLHTQLRRSDGLGDATDRKESLDEGFLVVIWEQQPREREGRLAHGIYRRECLPCRYPQVQVSLDIEPLQLFPDMCSPHQVQVGV